MPLNKQEYILNQLIQMYPHLEDAKYIERYKLAFKTLQNLKGSCFNYVLIELIDPITFESSWYWRKKS